MCNYSFEGPLQKSHIGIPLITIEYHSVSFSTIGSFNGILVGLNGTLKCNLKYHSIPMNGTCTRNPNYHSKNHSDNIQIPLAIITPSTIQVPFFVRCASNIIYLISIITDSDTNIHISTLYFTDQNFCSI